MQDNNFKKSIFSSEDERIILSTAVQQTSVAILITDLEGDIIYVNNAFENVTGYNAREVMGENPRILKSGFTHDQVYEKMWNKISNGEIWNGEQINKKKDGSFYYEDSRITPIYNKDGKLTYYMAVKHDITERKMLEAKLKEIAIRDPLTNSYSRWYLFERLNQISDNYKRVGHPFSVCIIDIDLFKEVNDKYGHQAGDFMLREFTKMIDEDIRSYDILGRYGGEEFILILPDTNKEESQQLVRRILKKVKDRKFIYQNEEIRLSFSAGIADSREIDINNFNTDAMIELSDKRLYKAKDTGRCKVVID